MKLYEPIFSDSIIDETLRICGLTTSAAYPNKSIIARVNAAMDKYWQLASNAAPKGTFDDENNTSLPVETQNIVSGTNYYKISSFTSNVYQILKLAVLDDNGIEHDLVREEFDNLNDFYETYTTDITGIPSRWIKMGDYIYLYPCPNYSETSGLRAYLNRELSKFNFVSFTVTQASPAVFTATGHGLAVNDALILETDGTLLTGLTADTVVYYVISAGLTADAFEVSTTIGGSAVNTTSTQTGNHKYIKVSKEPGIPVIHHPYLARMAALPFCVEKKLGQTNNLAQLIAQDEQGILDYWSHRDRDLSTIIQPEIRSYK
jgi:hypothetical protein